MGRERMWVGSYPRNEERRALTGQKTEVRRAIVPPDRENSAGLGGGISEAVMGPWELSPYRMGHTGWGGRECIVCL